MSAAVPGFADTFRQIVGPTLARECRFRGLLVAVDLSGFETAYQAILGAAIARGALHLPPAIFGDLEDWISSSLLKEAMSHEAAVREAGRVARRVARQCAKFGTAP